MTDYRPSLLFLIVLLTGCSTATSPKSSIVRYQPKEGERANMSTLVLTPVDDQPVPQVIPGPDLRYEAKFVGTAVRVVIEITIDPTGKVIDSKLVSADPEFAGPPVAAAFLRAKYRPAKKDGIAVVSQLRITDVFRL